ncbi:uncharacterized protein N7525_009673 [Penicillium rubens]|uniref:uncharacterized protein n=1 Tax=Penicillium rubens TaxID=1108849 RepID=UPI002A5A8723|nr:uncharacterized protein N7525_009673 [Penicillium rubens]KAJ5831420.1 hypothetical protein N7525_009673 [Penicillium rubens]KAJ5854964.1 hypothetical protein N7534_007507 [Penicillium rubens]
MIGPLWALPRLRMGGLFDISHLAKFHCLQIDQVVNIHMKTAQSCKHASNPVRFTPSAGGIMEIFIGKFKH